MKQVIFLAVFASVVLTAVYAVITLYDSNMKIGRMNQTPVIRPHEEPEPVMDKRTVGFYHSEVRVREELNAHPPAPRPWSDLSIPAKGEKDYASFCSHCHGPRLDGLGTVGQSFKPLPTDLTSQKAIAMTDGELFAVISYGTKKTPALASSMSVESRESVIRYIRFMQKNTN